ncbi:hypothetical protein L484_009643 [Morus notabilis]|uniref:S-protein homolog n=1 Tax=Morus notabilis TaxID=981085 RepID=W9RF60_9ROSA|nr:hypothetical protein L484_009643 [Morus notabilis]
MATMNFSPRFQLVVVFSLVFLSIVSETSQGLLSKTHVKMTNNLGDVDLTVHCKSKNDDLGDHLLHLNESYEFSFRTNFWGTTHFYCSFKWAPDQFQWFDIFDMEKPRADSCTECFWVVHINGLCRMDPNNGLYNICFPWNQGTTPAF